MCRAYARLPLLAAAVWLEFPRKGSGTAKFGLFSLKKRKDVALTLSLAVAVMRIRVPKSTVAGFDDLGR